MQVDLGIDLISQFIFPHIHFPVADVELKGISSMCFLRPFAVFRTSFAE
jgi:hypothetical protein